MSTRSFVILNSSVSWIFVLLDSSNSHRRASSIYNMYAAGVSEAVGNTSCSTALDHLNFLYKLFLVTVPHGCTVFQTGLVHTDLGICLGTDTGGL